MTVRQALLKGIYPLLTWANKISGKNKILSRTDATPAVSFYELNCNLADGSPFSLDSLKGKKVLLVNTASDCGYTAQYAELQQLYSAKKDKLVIIAFPSNEFKNQETGSNAEIAAFCRKNYGVEFPVAEKCRVLPGEMQHAVYSWLTNPQKNGWNKQQPVWNFCKYLVNEQGQLTHFFSPALSPLGKEIPGAIG